ncbi:MAG: ABC transporter permease, partial [Acidobacteria bacterium]|nr:ABC transporter permease [Acidobacteriota bacterium]
MSAPATSAIVAVAGRIGAMILRHVYLLRTSWPRLFELMYWPTIQMVLWGFITRYLMTSSSVIAQASGVLISAVLLWDVLFRGQLGFSLSFLEEIWSRNLANLSVSPLRPAEFLAALAVMSLIRTLIGILPATGLAILFYDT